MFNGLKNFAINKVLRHVADNARLNATTNWIAVIIMAALGVNANWILLISYFQHPTPEALKELVRVAGTIAGATLLYFVGKFPGLKDWLPVANDILAEAEKELRSAPVPAIAAKPK